MRDNDDNLIQNEDLLSIRAREERKAERKRLKEIEDSLETGTLGPWERYRVLTDFLEYYSDILEMGDRKTRFALVILGALNAVNLVLMARPDVLSGSSLTPGTGTAIYIVIYLGLSLYLFVEAISALRPRVAALSSEIDAVGLSSHKILGIRFISTFNSLDLDQYYELCRRAKCGDVNREVALGIQIVGRVLMSKYKAIDRLYAGLLILVFLTAGMIAFLVMSRVFGSQTV
jgi:hypothetical protein